MLIFLINLEKILAYFGIVFLHCCSIQKPYQIICILFQYLKIIRCIFALCSLQTRNKWSIISLSEFCMKRGSDLEVRGGTLKIGRDVLYSIPMRRKKVINPIHFQHFEKTSFIHLEKIYVRSNFFCLFPFFNHPSYGKLCKNNESPLFYGSTALS